MRGGEWKKHSEVLPVLYTTSQTLHLRHTTSPDVDAGSGHLLNRMLRSARHEELSFRNCPPLASGPAQPG